MKKKKFFFVYFFYSCIVFFLCVSGVWEFDVFFVCCFFFFGFFFLCSFTPVWGFLFSREKKLTWPFSLPLSFRLDSLQISRSTH